MDCKVYIDANTSSQWLSVLQSFNEDLDENDLYAIPSQKDICIYIFSHSSKQFSFRILKPKDQGLWSKLTTDEIIKISNAILNCCNFKELKIMEKFAENLTYVENPPKELEDLITRVNNLIENSVSTTISELKLDFEKSENWIEALKDYNKNCETNLDILDFIYEKINSKFIMSHYDKSRNSHHNLNAPEIYYISSHLLKYYNEENLNVYLKAMKNLHFNTSSKKISDLIVYVEYLIKEKNKVKENVSNELQKFKDCYEELLKSETMGSCFLNATYKSYCKDLEKLKVENSRDVFYNNLKDRISKEIDFINKLNRSQDNSVQKFYDYSGNSNYNFMQIEIKNNLKDLTNHINNCKNATWFDPTFEICKLSSVWKDIENVCILSEKYTKLESFRETLSHAVDYIENIEFFIDKPNLTTKIINTIKDACNLRLTPIEFSIWIIKEKIAQEKIAQEKNTRNKSNRSYFNYSEEEIPNVNMRTSSFYNYSYTSVKRIELQKLMGVSVQQVTFAELKRQYKAWMFENHPDRNKNSASSSNVGPAKEIYREIAGKCDPTSNTLI